MMPGLLVGDRLVVSKYPYGWSWVSPSFHILPRWQGRLWGEMPERGDVVIVTPPGENSDYIKRVIGLPGDTIEVVDGIVYLNGGDPPRGAAAGHAADRRQPALRTRRFQRLPGARGGRPDVLPAAGVPRDLAQRPILRHDRRRPCRRRRFRPRHRAGGACLPDGRQSRSQRRQPLPAGSPSAAWAGRCRGRISAAAPSSSPSASTAARAIGIRSAGSPRLRGGRSGTSLRPIAPSRRPATRNERRAERLDADELEQLDAAGPTRCAIR